MRTGAIFARGSCRALKWMALFGVVFAVGAGAAVAQPPAPRDLEVVPTDVQADGTTALGTPNDADSGAMLLTWREPSDSRTVTHYQWSSDGGAAWVTDATDPNNANLRAAVFEDLPAGAEFIFAVRALHDIDGDGTSGETTPNEISAPITFRARAIGIPVDPTYTATFPKAADEQVMLSWTATATQARPIDSYEYRYGVATQQAADSVDFTSDDWSSWRETTGTTATVSDLTNGSRYVFEVRAVNMAGMSATPAPGAAIPATTPSEPQNLVADTSGGDGQVVLTWDAPSRTGGSAVTGYEYRIRDGSAWRAPNPVGATTVTLDNLTPRRSHTFDVRAVNAVGPGAMATVMATPTGAVQPPSAPQNLTVTVGNQMLTLAWTAPMYDGGASITDYEYEMDGSGTWVSAGLDETEAVTGLRNGQSYAFRVRAVNSEGAGEPSASMSGIPAGQVPSMPQMLTATVGDMMVVLSWTAPASDGGPSIIRYEYNVDGGGTWMSTGQETTATVTGLTNGQTYTFGVRAVNDAGNGAMATVDATPMGAPVPDVTVKSVSAATTVDEAAGLEVTVTATVPAGTGTIASKMVHVTFPTDNAAITARDAAEADDTTVLGSTAWTNIKQAASAADQTFKFRVAIGQDLDAEDEKFQVEARIDGAAKRSDVITIDDAEEQKFELSLPAAAKGAIKEGESETVTLKADPAKTVDIPVTLTLSPNEPSKYTLGTTSGTFGTGSFSTTISTEADGDREDDTITVTAYTPGTLGNDVMLAELDITVTDINALPGIKGTLVDKDGKDLDPQPETAMEGETVKIKLTAVDKDGKAVDAAETLTVSLTPSSGSSQDYRLSTHPIVIDKGKKSSAVVDLTLESDDDLGMEMLVFDASVAGDSKIGSVPRSVTGVLSIGIDDGTMKLVEAKTQDEVYAVFNPAKEAGMGTDGLNPGETIMFDASMMFTPAAGVTVAYSATSDNPSVASVIADGGSGMTTITANAAGPTAHITVTATATPPSGVQILDQTSPYVASVLLPVDVVLAALTVDVTADPMEIMEGESTTITATANRPVAENTTIDLDVISSNGSDDHTLEIMIPNGMRSGSTMLGAVQDDDYDDMSYTVVATGPGIDGSQNLVIMVMDDDEAPEPPEPTNVITAKSSDEIYPLLMAAGLAGDDAMFNPGMMAELDASMMFDVMEGYTTSYAAESDAMNVASTSVSGNMVTVTAGEAGMAHVVITGTATMASGVMTGQPATNVATVMFPVNVSDMALVITVSTDPMDMVEEGGTITVTAKANRNVVAADGSVQVTLTITGAVEMNEATITIAAGDMGTAMVQVLDDMEVAPMADITIVATGSGIATAQTFTIAVTENDSPRTFTLTAPEDMMNLVEGGDGVELTVTADPAVSVDTEVMIMVDRAAGTAGPDDFTAEPIMIMAGETSGTTMLMATEDMVDDSGHGSPEMLVVFAMADNTQSNTVSFYIWDMAVPALPVIAQLLLAAFLAIGGYRRYLRR